MSHLRIPLLIAVFLMGLTIGMHADSSTIKEQDWTEESIKRSLEEVEHLIAQGKNEEALDLANKLHDATTDLKHIQLELEARYQVALLHYYNQDFEEARTSIKIGLTRAGMEGLDMLKADFLTVEGMVEWKQGNLTIASEKLKDALEMHRSNGQELSMISTTNNLGIIAYSRKDYLAATRYYRQGLAWLEGKDHDRLRASLTSNLAESLIPLDQLEEAEIWLNESLELEEKMGEPRGLAYTYLNLGELRSKQGDSTEAIGHYNQALRLQDKVGDDWGACLTQLKRGREFAKSGELELAMHVLQKGMDQARSMNSLSILADYAHDLQDVNRQIGNDGMATYYHDLQDWLHSRINNEGTLSLDAGSDPGAEPDDSEQHVTAGTHYIETIALTILVGLIATLLLENMRLRKKSRNL